MGTLLSGKLKNFYRCFSLRLKLNNMKLNFLNIQVLFGYGKIQSYLFRSRHSDAPDYILSD